MTTKLMLLFTNKKVYKMIITTTNVIKFTYKIILYFGIIISCQSEN
jgi:hypothetical protein